MASEYIVINGEHVEIPGEVIAKGRDAAQAFCDDLLAKANATAAPPARARKAAASDEPSTE